MSYNTEEILLELYKKTSQNIDPKDPILKVFEAQQVIIDFFQKDISAMHDATKETLYKLADVNIQNSKQLQEKLSSETEEYLNGITNRTITFLQQSTDSFNNSLVQLDQKLENEEKIIKNTITSIKKHNRNIFYVLLSLAICNVATLIILNYCLFNYFKH